MCANNYVSQFHNLLKPLWKLYVMRSNCSDANHQDRILIYSVFHRVLFSLLFCSYVCFKLKRKVKMRRNKKEMRNQEEKKDEEEIFRKTDSVLRNETGAYDLAKIYFIKYFINSDVSLLRRFKLFLWLKIIFCCTLFGRIKHTQR